MRVPSILLILALAASPQTADELDGTGSVSLPLADYEALLERVDAAERADPRDDEKPVAALAVQRTRITVDGDVAEVVTRYRVELAGTPTPPVTLPFGAIAEEVEVEPRQGAALDRNEDGVVLYAPRPGGYTVVVRGRQTLDGDGGDRRLRLAASPAPVTSVELELPADYEWSMDGAVVVGDELRGGRRLVRLAPARGIEHELRMRRRLAGREEDRVLARSTAVSVVEVRDRALWRQDVVLYEVLRGGLGKFELGVPAGFEVDRVATDEGDAVALVTAGRLTVERRQRLAGTGHLVITYRPRPLDAAPLRWPWPEPRIEPQARYLMAASAIAAELEPLPAASWRRVDLEDLPGRLYAELASLAPNAVWRLVGDAADTRLTASPLPAAERVGGVIWERATTTFLTVDGTLVHRDRLVVETTGTAFEIGLPAGAELWSARVDDLAVRPHQRGDTLVVPLAFRSGGRTVIEIVAVEERAIERGRSALRMTAPRVAEPVVRHEWRLLLPEENRYRFAAGELHPVAELGELATGASVVDSVSLVPAPVSGLTGLVTDDEGHPLPGVTLRIRGTVDRVAVSDAAGRFDLPDLPGGRYRFTAALDGFGNVEYPDLAVRHGRVTQLHVELAAAVEESITVSAGAPLLDARELARRLRESENRRLQEIGAREVRRLRRDLRAGVKPLRVEIPATGKLLILSGAMPPSRVTVELDVRAR